jgi:formylmethanofuran dehydrogenase subunit E
MAFPAFFADAPSIIVHDPLSAFLGAPADGLMEYRYEDAVRLAGHSCPTVAGAWLMTLKAMKTLWPGQTPERGLVRVLLDDSQDEGVTGVIAAIAGLITGAAGPGGFKGLAGRFGRNDLLSFNAGTLAELGFARLDTGRTVTAHYHPELVPADPDMRIRLQRLLSGMAQADDGEVFGLLWQDRVRRILVDFADHPGLVRIEEA